MDAEKDEKIVSSYILFACLTKKEYPYPRPSPTLYILSHKAFSPCYTSNPASLQFRICNPKFLNVDMMEQKSPLSRRHIVSSPILILQCGFVRALIMSEESFRFCADWSSVFISRLGRAPGVRICQKHP